jgi:hypothetical protein
MLYESQYLLEEMGRQRIETLRNETEEKRLLKMGETTKAEVTRYVPYAIALTSILIAITAI